MINNNLNFALLEISETKEAHTLDLQKNSNKKDTLELFSQIFIVFIIGFGVCPLWPGDGGLIFFTLVSLYLVWSHKSKLEEILPWVGGVLGIALIWFSTKFIIRILIPFA